MASSKTQSYGASVIPMRLQRSLSAPGKFSFSSISSSPTSPSSRNPINDARWGPPLISIHRKASPGPSVASSSSWERNQIGSQGNSKETSMSSPTTNLGSFRCSSHKSVSDRNRKNSNSDQLSNWHRLYTRRLAMKNSLVRIGTIEGDFVKQAKASLIRPSSNHQRRRCDFQPSRLSVMSKAEDRL